KFVAMHQGTEIMTRAADDESYAVVLMNFINNLCEMLLQLLDRKGGLRYDDINHMMSDARSFIFPDFACTDILSPVYLHGITADDLKVELLGDFNTESRLAYRCRPYQNQNFL